MSPAKSFCARCYRVCMGPGSPHNWHSAVNHHVNICHSGVFWLSSDSIEIVFFLGLWWVATDASLAGGNLLHFVITHVLHLNEFIAMYVMVTLLHSCKRYLCIHSMVWYSILFYAMNSYFILWYIVCVNPHRGFASS